MVIIIKDILEMVKKMVKVNLNMHHQEIHIQDSLEKIKDLVKVLCYMQMVIDMKVIGLQIKNMVEENIHMH